MARIKKTLTEPLKEETELKKEIKPKTSIKTNKTKTTSVRKPVNRTNTKAKELLTLNKESKEQVDKLIDQETKRKAKNVKESNLSESNVIGVEKVEVFEAENKSKIEELISFDNTLFEQDKKDVVFEQQDKTENNKDKTSEKLINKQLERYQLNLTLPKERLEQLKAFSEKKGAPVSVLARMWIIEKIEEELLKSRS